MRVYHLRITLEITADGRKTRKQTQKRYSRPAVHFMVLRFFFYARALSGRDSDIPTIVRFNTKLTGQFIELDIGFV